MTRETIAKFVDAFLADDAEECHKPEYENLAALVPTIAVVFEGSALAETVLR